MTKRQPSRFISFMVKISFIRLSFLKDLLFNKYILCKLLFQTCIGMTNKLSIKKWAKDEQPREKLLQRSVSTLSLNELFAILLRSGSDGESALELARRIMADNNNDLNILARKGIKELTNTYKGIGLAKAATIIAAMEIGRRRQPDSRRIRSRIGCSRDAYQYIHPFMQDLEHEEFWVIYLSTGNYTKGCRCLSSGGMDGTVIDVRMLFRGALDMKASSILIAHNHPGGTLSPSIYDEIVTQKIFEGGTLLDIQLFDHLIIGDHDYYSFADEGRLNSSAKNKK